MTKQTDQRVESSFGYRDKYRKTIKQLLVMAVTCVVLTVSLVFLSVRQPEPTFYASTTNGQLIEVHSLSQPVVTQKYLLEWAAMVARKSFNFDWVHYQSQLNEVKNDFTTDGWGYMQQALKDSGMLDTVINEKVSVSAVLEKTPVVLNRSIVHGHYTWTVQLPMLVTYSSASEHKKEHVTVTMRIMRVPVLTAPKGIQVTNFSASTLQ